MVMSIFNIVFFMGIFWYVICDLVYDNFILENDFCDDHNLTWRSCPYNNLYFLENFGLLDQSTLSHVVILMYFSFTTLSCIGFGDYYPVADVERLIAIFILLFGVAMFTIIKDNFCQILFSFMDLTANFDDSDNINMFLSLL
jgi:hypothetical protein